MTDCVGWEKDAQMPGRKKRDKQEKRQCECVCGVLILGELLQMTCTLAHTCALINNNHDMKKGTLRKKTRQYSCLSLLVCRLLVTQNLKEETFINDAHSLLCTPTQQRKRAWMDKNTFLLFFVFFFQFTLRFDFSVLQVRVGGS